MKGFDEDPLDLLGDDGDGVNEMCLFLDEGTNKQTDSKPPGGNSGCCVTFLAGHQLDWLFGELYQICA